MAEHGHGQFASFIHYCEYAKICSLTIKQLYGVGKARVRTENVDSTIATLDRLLHSWRQSAPQLHTSGDVDGRDLSRLLDVDLAYHELVITIHHK